MYTPNPGGRCAAPALSAVQFDDAGRIVATETDDLRVTATNPDGTVDGADGRTLFVQSASTLSRVPLA